MSDESPRDERPAHDAPVDEGAPTDETPPAAEGAAEPPPPPPAAPARSGFYVPRWAALVAAAVVALLLLFGGGFAIGRVTAGDGDHEGRERRTEHEFPGRRGGGSEGPNAPRPTSGVFLGVATRDATGDVKGAEVVNVASGSPAAQAGLQTGDIITAVDGSTVTSASDLAQKVRSHQSGDQVTITYSRGGNSAQAQVTLGNRSPAGTPSA